MDCYWKRCSDKRRCTKFGSCVADAQRNALADFPIPTKAEMDAVAVEKLTEDERHAIAHAEWAISHATPEKPEVSFDYELVRTLLGLIKSGKASVGIVG